jgi:hypothetical protein
MPRKYIGLNLAAASRLLGVLSILFGLLFFASNSNELLKQAVLTADAFAALQAEVDCRADELEEEGLSFRECELMLVQVEIALESSPRWFRSVQQILSGIGIVAALVSIALALSLGSNSGNGFTMRLMVWVLGALVALDGAMFIAASQTGPLLRAQYLWPLLLWFFIHLSLVLGAWVISKNINKKLMN